MGAPIGITLSKAKQRLSELLDRVEAGEHFEITRGGKPVALLLAHRPGVVAVGGGGGGSSKPDDVVSGILRPAPAAAKLYPEPARIAQAQGIEAPAPEGSLAPPKPAHGPKIAPATAGAESLERKLSKGLTLADVLRAAQEP